jgi:hypothetical protein
VICAFGGMMSGADLDEVFLKVRGGGPNAASFVLSGIRLERFFGYPGLIDASSAPGQANILIDGFTDAFNGGYPAEWSSATTYTYNPPPAAAVMVRVGSGIYQLVETSTNNPPATSPTKWIWRGNYIRPVRLGALTNCTVRGAAVRGPFAHVDAGIGTAQASLRLENCRLLYTASDMVTVGTNGSWKTFDCTDVNGLPIRDLGTWPYGPVLLAGRPGGQVVTGGTGSGDNFVLVSGHVSNPTLTFIVLPTQTANLTQWINSTNTVLLQINPDGYITTPNLGAQGTTEAGKPVVLIAGKGSSGPGTGPSDVNGGAGGSLTLTAGDGGDGYAGNTTADGGNGGSVKLQAGVGGNEDGGVDGLPGEVVVNESGLSVDFRVESNNDASCLKVDGATDAVRLGGHVNTRVYQNAPNTEPSNSNMTNSQISFWIDEASGELNAGVRYSDGTQKILRPLALTDP